MAASGTFAFNPQLADQVDEAFESCGIDPADLKARHIRSALRSANLMLTSWQNFGYNQFALVKTSQPLTAGDADFVLPTGAYDIFHATLKRDGRETEMYPISRSDYNALHDKTQQGRPDRYFVDRSTYTGSTQASTVYLYQAPENSTDTIELWYMRRLNDAGDMSNTLDLPPHFQYAFACGLAYHLSLKFAPERTDRLMAIYLGPGYDPRRHSIPGGALGLAMSEDRERAPAVFRVSYGTRRGR